MNINNIKNFLPSLLNIFYSEIYEDKNISFCSFMKDLKSNHEKFNKLAFDLAEKIKPFEKEIDLFVSVPKFSDEINETDYAKILAEILSTKLNIPYESNFLLKTKKTKKLKTIPQSERSREISSAFEVNFNEYRKICIVDDILASGATLKEVVTTFEKSGFKNISAAVLIIQNS